MATLPLGDDKIMSELIIDSGSSVMWIPKEECGPNHDSGLARDCDVAQEKQSLHYLDGSIHGRKTKTTVWISHSQIKSPNHHLAVIDERSRLMKKGILGLAKGYEQDQTFLDTLKANGLIHSRSFSLFSHNGASSLILGGIDYSKISKNHLKAVASLTSDSAFRFTLQSARVGKLNFMGEDKNALLDSGNTLISFPMSASRSFIGYLQEEKLDCYLEVEANPQFSEIVCNLSNEDKERFPDLGLTIEGKEFVVPGAYLIEICEKNPNAFDPFAKPHQLKVACLIKIEFQTGYAFTTIGKAFIEKVYTTFDLEKGTISLIQNV